MCLAILVFAYFLLILFLSTLFFPMPVNDSGAVRYRSLPYATFFLILLNMIIFVGWIAPELYGGEDEVTLEVSEDYMGKMNSWGYRETVMRAGEGVGAFAAFSSLFMHADFWHLFSNMVYLWTFGRRVEDACGPWRFLGFYLLTGMLAHLGSVLFNPANSSIPSIGASGAISGVMGAYLFLFPGAAVTCLWGIGMFLRLPIAVVRSVWSREDEDTKLWRWTVTLPAWLLLIWFLVQNTIPSLETIRQQEDLPGVNTLAHLSGFLGALTIFFFVRKDLLTRYLSGRSI
jgi:membrane associated rhomboid family serine protease